MSKKLYICVCDNYTSDPESSVEIAYNYIKDEHECDFADCSFYEVTEVQAEQKISLVETVVLNTRK